MSDISIVQKMKMSHMLPLSLETELQKFHLHILREIGRGGMACIYEVVNRQGEKFAVKWMLEHEKKDEAEERFLREHQTLSLLVHESILHVYQQGFSNNRPFFIMEYVEGHTLQEEIALWKDISDEDRFEKIDRILKKIAVALYYIHSQGLVHRDLTPNNIMITTDGGIRIMDFGVVHTPETELTQFGSMLGTISCMSPEQIKGEELDSRSDLYALGVILYRMITGKYPFSASSYAGYLSQHLTQPPNPPSSIRPLVPSKLEKCCLRLLEKEPLERFSSTRHMLLYLEYPLVKGVFSIIGRNKEVSVLRKAIVQYKQQQDIYIVSGPSGSGCSYLLQEAHRFATERCIKNIFLHNTSTKQGQYQGFANLKEHPQLGKDVRELLSEDIESSKSKSRWIIYENIVKILKKETKVLIMDNIDRADEGTLECLRYILRNHPDAIHILCYHRKTNQILDILQKFSYHTIQTSQLEVSEIEAFLLEHIDSSENISKLAPKLHKVTKGNPTLLKHILKNTSSAEDIFGYLNNEPTLKDALKFKFTSCNYLEQEILVILSLLQSKVSRHIIFECCKQTYKNLSFPDFQQKLLELKEKELISLQEENLRILNSTLQSNILHWKYGTQTDNVALKHKNVALVLEKLQVVIPSISAEDIAYHCQKGNLIGKAYHHFCSAYKKQADRGLIESSVQSITMAKNIQEQALIHLPYVRSLCYRIELELDFISLSRFLGKMNQIPYAIQRLYQNTTIVPNPTLQGRIFLEKCREDRRQSNLTSAQKNGLEAIKILPTTTTYFIESLNELAGTFFELQNMKLAHKYFSQGFQQAEKNDSALGKAAASNGLGAISISQGRTREAQKHFMTSLQICKTHNLIEPKLKPLTNLVEIYHFTGQFKKGLRMIDEYIVTVRKIDYGQGLALLLRFRAILLCDLGRYQEGNQNAWQAYLYQKQNYNPQEEFLSLVIWLRIQKKLGSFPKHLDDILQFDKVHDMEHFLPILHCFKGLQRASIGVQHPFLHHFEDQYLMPHQRIRFRLNRARYFHLLQDIELAHQDITVGYHLAEQHRFTHYQYLFQHLLLEIEPENQKYQQRKRSFEKTLLSGISQSDQQTFLSIHS
jgi:serine/threonine protein kinase